MICVVGFFLFGLGDDQAVDDPCLSPGEERLEIRPNPTSSIRLILPVCREHLMQLSENGAVVNPRFKNG